MTESIWLRATAIVARLHGFEAHDVRSPRGYSARRARHLALYAVAIGGCVSLSRLARIASTDRRNLRRLLAQIEGARDDPAIDRHLTVIERRLAGYERAGDAVLPVALSRRSKVWRAQPESAQPESTQPELHQTELHQSASQPVPARFVPTWVRAPAAPQQEISR